MDHGERCILRTRNGLCSAETVRRHNHIVGGDDPGAPRTNVGGDDPGAPRTNVRGDDPGTPRANVWGDDLGAPHERNGVFELLRDTNGAQRMKEEGN